MQGSWPWCLISSNDETAGAHFSVGLSFDIETLMIYLVWSLCDGDGWDFCSVIKLYDDVSLSCCLQPRRDMVG